MDICNRRPQWWWSCWNDSQKRITNAKSGFRIEKVIKKKDNKLYIKWKVYDSSFNNWVVKKILLYKMSYFPEPCSDSKNKIKVKLDLSNSATKTDLKGVTGIDTRKFAKKTDLTSLKDVNK